MRFSVIYADVPYQFRNKNTGGSLKSGASYVYGANNKYSTMSTKDICEVPVRLIAEKDSVLFLWATNAMFTDAMEIMKAYGYVYKSKLTWIKTQKKKGMGFWYRNRTEDLLFGIKGKVKAFHCQEDNVVFAPITKHSEKPEEMRQKIMDGTQNMLSPTYIELFARKTTKNWTCIGYEINKEDIRESINKLVAL